MISNQCQPNETHVCKAMSICSQESDNPVLQLKELRFRIPKKKKGKLNKPHQNWMYLGSEPTRTKCCQFL